MRDDSKAPPSCHAKEGRSPAMSEAEERNRNLGPAPSVPSDAAPVQLSWYQMAPLAFKGVEGWTPLGFSRRGAKPELNRAMWFELPTQLPEYITTAVSFVQWENVYWTPGVVFD